MMHLPNTRETRYRCWLIETHVPDHACQVLLWLVDVQGNVVPAPQTCQYIPPEQRGPDAQWYTIFGTVERPHPCQCFIVGADFQANGCLATAWSFLPQYEEGSPFWLNSAKIPKPIPPAEYYRNVVESWLQIGQNPYNWLPDTRLQLLAAVGGQQNEVAAELAACMHQTQWQRIVVNPEYDPEGFGANHLRAALIAFRDNRLIRALGSEQAFWDSTMAQLHKIKI